MVRIVIGVWTGVNIPVTSSLGYMSHCSQFIDDIELTDLVELWIVQRICCRRDLGLCPPVPGQLDRIIMLNGYLERILR